MFGVRSFRHQWNALDVHRPPPEVKLPPAESGRDASTHFRQRLHIHPRRERLQLSSSTSGDRPQARPGKHAAFRDRLVGVMNAHYETKLENDKRHLRVLHERHLRKHDDQVSKIEYDLRLMQVELRRNSLQRMRHQQPGADLTFDEIALKNRAKHLNYDPGASSYLNKKNNIPCRARRLSYDESATLREARDLLASRVQERARAPSGRAARVRPRCRTILPGSDMAHDVLIARSVLTQAQDGPNAFLTPKLLKFYMKHKVDANEVKVRAHWRDWRDNMQPASSMQSLRWDHGLGEFFPTD